MHLPPALAPHPVFQLTKAKDRDGLLPLIATQRNAVTEGRTIQPPTRRPVELVHPVLPPSVGDDNRHFPTSGKVISEAGTGGGSRQKAVKGLYLELWEYPSHASTDGTEIVVQAEKGADCAKASTVVARAGPIRQSVDAKRDLGDVHSSDSRVTR